MPRPTLRRASRFALVLSILAAAVALPATASASRAPTDSELGVISTVVVDDCGLHQGNCALQGAVVSDVDDQYAVASAKGDTAGYDALLYNSGEGANDWTVLIVESQATPTSCSVYTALGVPDEALDDLEVQGLRAGQTTASVCGKPAAKPKVCAPVKAGSRRSDVSVLRISCSKARAVVSSSLKHAPKAPSGWSWVDPAACSSFIVPRRYRKVEHPLIDVPKSRPVIFVDDASTPECTGTDASATPAT